MLLHALARVRAKFVTGAPDMLRELVIAQTEQLGVNRRSRSISWRNICSPMNKTRTPLGSVKPYV